MIVITTPCEPGLTVYQMFNDTTNGIMTNVIFYKLPYLNIKFKNYNNSPIKIHNNI